MAILSKERPIWFTTARQQNLPGWVGDESSGFPAEELEKKIRERQVRTVANHKTEIVDVSELSDEDFTFRLEQIRPKQPKKQ